jgi:hypothetical protein
MHFSEPILIGVVVVLAAGGAIFVLLRSRVAAKKEEVIEEAIDEYQSDARKEAAALKERNAKGP